MEVSIATLQTKCFPSDSRSRKVSWSKTLIHVRQNLTQAEIRTGVLELFASQLFLGKGGDDGKSSRWERLAEPLRKKPGAGRQISPHCANSHGSDGSAALARWSVCLFFKCGEMIRRMCSICFYSRQSEDPGCQQHLFCSIIGLRFIFLFTYSCNILLFLIYIFLYPLVLLDFLLNYLFFRLFLLCIRHSFIFFILLCTLQ